MTRIRVEVTVDRRPDQLFVRWSTARQSGGARFDHLVGTRPEWLASAEELLDGADRRTADAVLDSVARWASDAQLEVGIWHEAGDIELLET